MDIYFEYAIFDNSTLNITDKDNLPIQRLLERSARLFAVSQFTIIASLGVLTNILPLMVTILGYVKRNVVNCMVANLACCELLLCLSFVFGQSFFILWREYISVNWCHLLSFLHFVAAFASFMFPPLLAINRYVALYHEHLYKIWYTWKKVAIQLAACWSFCAVVPLAFLIAGKTGYDEDNSHCCMVVKDSYWAIMYWLFIIFPLVCFCDGIMIFCNYKMYAKLKKHADQVTTLASNVVKENKEVLFFLVADMLFPICFHSTYHSFKFILIDRQSEFLKRFFISLYLTNSILRGIVTVAMLRPYRTAVVRLFRKEDSTVVQVVPANVPVPVFSPKTKPDSNLNLVSAP